MENFIKDGAGKSKIPIWEYIMPDGGKVKVMCLKAVVALMENKGGKILWAK